MSTQRYISTSFWDDKWIRSLNPSDRYLYMYLLTNTLTTISGIYRITIDRIAYDTGYDERTLRPMLAKFAEAKKAVLFEDEYMILPSWPKHQRWEKKDTIRAGIESDLANIPLRVKEYSLSIGYQYPIPGVQVPTELFYPDPDIHSDIDISEEPDASASSKNHFVKPTIEEVKEYCESRGNGVDGNKWIAHYESVGWKVGKNPMKDWKAAVRTWEPDGFKPVAPKRVCRKCKNILATAGDFIGHCWNEKCELYHCEKQA